MGSPTLVTQDFELGLLPTTTEYLPNFTTRLTNPRLHQTTTSYYAWDAPTQDYPNVIAHPEGATTSIERDAFGKTLSLLRTGTDGSWQRRYFRYNAQQELCNRTELESVTTALGYDAAGNLAWSAGGLAWTPNGCPDANDPNLLARRTTRTYDQRNRVTALTFPDGRGDTSYAYTPDGQLQTLTVDNAIGNGDQVTTSYAYNKRRLLAAETLQASGTMWSLVYQYTAHGNLASHIYPNGFTIAYAPDPLGRATTVGSYASSVLYHPNNAVESFTFGNGETHQMWQNLRGMPDRSRDASGSVAIVDDSYDYDANGNVAAITDALTGNVGNRDMTYDGLDRLKTVVAPKMFGGGATYAYDALDNMTRVAIGGAKARDHFYCYDTNLRLSNVKTGSCSGSSVIGLGYDVQGNLANKNGVLYAFDYGNRLRTVTQTGGAVSTYAYDGHGRRVRATDSGVDIFSMYAMDGTLVYQEDLKRNKRIYHAYLSGDPVAQVEVDITTGASTSKYLHTDALGSPVAVTNATSGVLERTQYEPYGLVINRALRDGPGYTGHVEDASSGLNYMQQRYYDPWIGRFLSVDPVTALDGDQLHFTRYSYAYNNPYKFTDPDGQCPSCAGAAAGVGLELLVQAAEIAIGSRDSFSGKDVLIAGVAGATGVGAARLISRGASLGKLAQFALNRMSDAGVSAGSQLAKKGSVSAKDTLIDVAGGVAVGDALGKRAGLAAANSPAGKLLEQTANRAERVAAGSSRPARQQAAEAARAAQKDYVNGKAAVSGVNAANATSQAVKITCTASGGKDC